MAAPFEWSVAGSYFEACNCESMCPCRVQDGAAGGASTEGECAFTLSWMVGQGHADGLDLCGLAVVMIGRYFDEERAAAGVPLLSWDVVLYVDERATTGQAEALEAIFLGRAGGSTLQNFAALIDTVRAVRRAEIVVDHRTGRESISVGDAIDVRARQSVATSSAITCAIPGHDHPGKEIVAEQMRVNDAGFDWDFSGRASFASEFSYASS